MWMLLMDHRKCNLIDLSEERAIVVVMDTLVTLLQQQGELFDGDFERHKIRSSTDKKKDNLVIHSRRCVILTNKELYKREIDKANAA